MIALFIILNISRETAFRFAQAELAPLADKYGL